MKPTQKEAATSDETLGIYYWPYWVGRKYQHDLKLAEATLDTVNYMKYDWSQARWHMSLIL